MVKRYSRIQEKLISPGFTLIELVVTISIIGLLASIILANVSGVRSKGNDAKRKTDLKIIALNLELYREAFGVYPSTAGAWKGNVPNGGSTTDWIPGLAPTYMDRLPQDPVYDPTQFGGWGGAYLYNSDGTQYKLLSHAPLASEVSLMNSTKEYYDPVRPTWAFAICSNATICTSW